MNHEPNEREIGGKGGRGRRAEREGGGGEPSDSDGEETHCGYAWRESEQQGLL